MNLFFTLFIIMFITLINIVYSTINGNGLRNYSEYFIEHETSLQSLKNYLNEKPTDLYSKLGKFGCKACTKFEYSYCLGPKLVYDHCCCDKKHFEPIAYIIHTCYAGAENCETEASNCEEYTRIRNCCCDSIYQQKNSSTISSMIQLFPFLSFLLFFYTFS